MSKSKKQKVLIVAVLMAAGVTASATFLAQTPRPDAAASKPAPPATSAKEEKRTSPSQLALLFSNAGLQVGAALPTANTSSYTELRLQWESLDKAGPSGLITEAQSATAGRLNQRSSTARAGMLPRYRSAELSPDQMLVVALDGKGAVRWWRLMIDPRLVRAEVGEPTEMRSENYYLARVDFIIECPDDPVLTELRFYRPVWNGEMFHLELLGSSPLH